MQPRALSEFLVGIARVLHDFNRAGAVPSAWKAAMNEALIRDAADDWTYGAAMLDRRLPVRPSHRLRPPSSETEFIQMARSLQMLDRWHAPLTGDENNFKPSGTTDHDLLEIEAANEGNLANVRGDILIPAYVNIRTPGGRGSAWQDERLSNWNAVITRAYGTDAHFPRTAEPDLVSSLLQYTAFIPATLDECRSRPINIRYRQLLPGQAEVGRAPRGSASWKIGLAPMAISSQDVSIEFGRRHDGEATYGITPVYPNERIDEVLERAVSDGVEILLIPEMALPAAAEQHVRNRIRQLRKSTPISDYNLRYIMAGVAAPPADGGASHTNAVIVLNGLTGDRILCQDKLYGWDLNPGQIRRMGLQDKFDPIPATVYENITHGDELTILDIPDFGRFCALICADMSEAHPGDWLLRSLSLDWLYSPIMDINTPCVRIDDSKANWIVRRATRAACSGKTRVMVTNSTSLSSLTQTENDRLKTGYSCFPSGIGFMLDAAGPSLQFRHLTHPKGDPMISAQLLYTFDWNTGWQVYDDDVP